MIKMSKKSPFENPRVLAGARVSLLGNKKTSILSLGIPCKTLALSDGNYCTKKISKVFPRLSPINFVEWKRRNETPTAATVVAVVVP